MGCWAQADELEAPGGLQVMDGVRYKGLGVGVSPSTHWR